MQLREVMTRDVEIINPETTIQDAAKKMREIDAGFLPVGENDRLVGTVTDRDITIRCTAEGKDPRNTRVREAMSGELIYCFEDQDSDEAARMMRDRQIRRLPVLNRDKRLVGVVSIGDIATETHKDQVVGDALEGISRHSGKA